MSGDNCNSHRDIQLRICFCFSISSGSWDFCSSNYFARIEGHKELLFMWLQLFVFTLLKIKTEKYLKYSFIYLKVAMMNA